jgi:PAS domain S-box-containing protein
MLSYLAPRLAGALLLHPQTVWPLWPGCALLVAVLLLVRRTIWPMVVPAALVAIALYDVQAGVPSGSIAWFIAADTVQVLITALCLGLFFDGMPRLNSIRALRTYAFIAVLLAPSAAAFLSALGIHGDYWRSWSIAFFSEALAFVTLLPAILTWVSNEPEWAQKSRAYQMEFAALITGLGLLGYVTFTASESSASPLLLSSLGPFLLWAALRFGSRGASSAVLVVTFLSIWAAVHGRGPFVERGALSSMLSLQLFLILAATSFMVLAALVEERKRTEDELREIEARFHFAAQAGRMYAYEWDAATDMVTRSEGCLNILGLSSSETQLTRQQFSAKVHPDDRALFVSADRDVTPENPTSKISYRVIRSDGCVVWVERNACAFFDEQGRLQRMVGMVADITERKRAEEALAGVSGKLITAQEHERTRIARELHDDIAQRLALLANELQQFREDSPNLPEVRKRVEELEKQTCEIASDIHSLSHELHSSKLEYLGMVPAMRSYCSEFSKQQKLEINFKNHDLPSTLPPAVSLCLFRVLQEALHNSAKYSGAKYIDVELRAMPNEIGLTVSDSGEGFDLKAAREGLGLGLISMEERLKVVGGDLLIESQPKHGTTIQARVPLRLENKAMHAAG